MTRVRIALTMGLASSPHPLRPRQTEGLRSLMMMIHIWPSRPQNLNPQLRVRRDLQLSFRKKLPSIWLCRWSR